MPNRKHSEDFKREAVRRLEMRGERTLAEARKERGEPLEEEVKRLRSEVAYLKRQQEILKKAALGSTSRRNTALMRRV